MLETISLMPATHLCYLVIGIGITIWVARTLRIRGRVFLARGGKGNDELTESLSHLLSVGFYLLHVGFVLLLLKVGGYVIDTVGAIELLSTKIGVVLIILGISHVTHIAIYTRIHATPREPDGLGYEYATPIEIVKS